MIASLSGTVTSIQGNKLCIVQQAIGFEVSCPQAKTIAVQSNITVHTYLHWNQEQGPSLFGFLEALDKDVFLLIISCSGIGPKMGISILEQIEASSFLQLIIEENIAQLSKLKSIGEKKAQQLCMNLKHKAPTLIKSHPSLATKTPLGIWNDLHETLTSLNYSSTEIKQATSILKEQVDSKTSATFDQLLRKALQVLAKK